MTIVQPAAVLARDPQDETMTLVRQGVRRLLTSSASFAKLDPATRNELAHSLVNVCQYLTDAGGETRTAPLELSAAPGRSLDDSVPGPTNEGAGPTAGGDFGSNGGAVAAKAGVAELGNAIDNVDFPGFVSGLIDGVFTAIVDSSIKQMEAFAELVKNVSKSVDAFMRDNVSEDQARDYLVDSYPDYLEIDTSGDAATVVPRQDADTDALPDFFADLGLAEPVDSLDEDTIEQTLVPSARRKLAMDRQQVLLSLVLMGINRLIVTDGSIRASVVFELKTRDRVTKSFTRAEQYNKSRYESRSKRKWGWIFSPTEREYTSVSEALSVSTVNESDSEAKVDLKTKLTGDVNVRFRSETFPLDRMTEILGVVKPEPPKPAVPPADASTAAGTASPVPSAQPPRA